MGFGECHSPKSQAETQEKYAKKGRLIPYSDPKDAKRRAKLEKDPERWLRYYLENRFPLPFGDVHRKMVAACIRAMATGSSITVAAPRGFGKTAVEWGMAFYAVLTGLSRFPVVIGWKANAGSELLDQWANELATNERLAEDYPCQCAPFHDSQASKRLKGLLRSVNPDARCGSDIRKKQCVIILPDVKEPSTGRTMPQCALAGASMNGSIKGLNIGLLSGESLRPDVALLDDPQDEQTADSPVLIKKVIKKIDYGIRSLAGPRRRLTVMAAVTCVNIGDVSEHLLTRAGTEVIITGQITAWPTGWTDKDSTSRALWDEWNTHRLGGLENLDGGKRARAFYKSNKAALTEGMAISWKERYHQSDGVRIGDPDALFAAMWDFYELGEFAFMAERQNTPVKEGVTVFSLSPKAILSRVDPTRNAGDVPEYTRLIVAATDINPSYALTSEVRAFGADQRNGVLWYGLHAMSVSTEQTDAEIKKAIMAQLAALWENTLSRLPCKPTYWIIDGGGSPENTVIDFAAANSGKYGVTIMCAFGRAAKQYRAIGKAKYRMRVYEQCHETAESYSKRWIIFNADHWRKQSHQAWTGTLGAPGSCDLPKGKHEDYADQICREQLMGQVELNGKTIYDWKTATGPHDYGDTGTMCFVAAAINGIGTGGNVGRKQKSQQKQRRVGHVSV